MQPYLTIFRRSQRLFSAALDIIFLMNKCQGLIFCIVNVIYIIMNNETVLILKHLKIQVIIRGRMLLTALETNSNACISHIILCKISSFLDVEFYLD